MKPRRTTLRFADLFAGLGGFHQAAEHLGGECVFASEIDADLREVYQKNFGIEAHGDIREVKPEQVPQHDLLCAGFPCQPFSKAGDQMGWDAMKSDIFAKTEIRLVQRLLENFRDRFRVNTALNCQCRECVSEVMESDVFLNTSLF